MIEVGKRVEWSGGGPDDGQRGTVVDREISDLGPGWLTIKWDDGMRTTERAEDVHVVVTLDPVLAAKHPTIQLDDNGVPCVRDTGMPVTTVLRLVCEGRSVPGQCGALRFAADMLDKRGAL